MHRKSSPLSWRNSKENFKMSSDTSLKGTVESFTIVRSPPKGFEKNIPYILALISLNNGKKIVSEIVNCRNLSIGAKVEPCLRRICTAGDDGIIAYGTKFRLSK